VLRSVQADFRELPAHPATISEFKQIEFFDLTGKLGVLPLPVNYAAFLTAAFFGAAFLRPTDCGLAASARLSAQRFFRAATMAALPAGLSLRLRFGDVVVAALEKPLAAAHLLR
jgi:hypothetical protein